MQGRERFDEVGEAQKQFNQLLKRSHHFADVINTQRIAMEEIATALASTLASSNPVAARVMWKTLRALQLPTGRPSVDAERQLLTRGALHALGADESRRKPNQDRDTGHVNIAPKKA